jgi:hypothetical protein
MGSRHIRAKMSTNVRVMYPSGKENVLVTGDQKLIKAVSKLGSMGNVILRSMDCFVDSQLLPFIELW